MSLAEEFQIIYVATAASRKWQHKSPLLKCEQCLVTPLRAGQHSQERAEGGTRGCPSGESWPAPPWPGEPGEHQQR